MKYFKTEPDVPGRLSHDTINSIRNGRWPDLITYIFECWPDDDIAQADPFYIVSEDLANILIHHAITGINIGICMAEKGDQFNIASPGCGNLPTFKWLNVVGKSGIDDFGITPNLELMISERALNVLKEFNVENCDVTPM